MTPSSPVDTIEKALEGKNRIQGMVRSIDQYRNGDPKAVAEGSYAQVLYALTDYKHDVLVLWDFAVATARQAEAMKREMAELRRIGDGMSNVLHHWKQQSTILESDRILMAIMQEQWDAVPRSLIGGGNAE